MNDKFGVVVGIIVAVAVIITMIVFLMNAQPLEIGEYVLVGLVVIIILGAAYIIARRFRSVKAGMPSEDERSKLVNYKAGYYAFIVAIWASLGIGFASDMMAEDFGMSIIPRHVSSIILLITGLAFVVSYLILNRKGDVA